MSGNNWDLCRQGSGNEKLRIDGCLFMRLREGVGSTLKALHWRLLAASRPKASLGPVFVVGTGRSGTHFLTRTLITHRGLDDLVGGRENPFVFKRVEGLAVSLETSASDLVDVLKRYRVLSAASQPQRLLNAIQSRSDLQKPHERQCRHRKWFDRRIVSFDQETDLQGQCHRA